MRAVIRFQIGWLFKHFAFVAWTGVSGWRVESVQYVASTAVLTASLAFYHINLHTDEWTLIPAQPRSALVIIFENIKLHTAICLAWSASLYMAGYCHLGTLQKKNAKTHTRPMNAPNQLSLTDFSSL